MKVENYMPDQCDYCSQFDHTELTCYVKKEVELRRPEHLRRRRFKEYAQELVDSRKKLGTNLPAANKNIRCDYDNITSEVESQAALYTIKPKEMKDASTNTPVYGPLNTMMQNVKTYANIMGQFQTKLGSFVKLMDECHIDTNNRKLLTIYISSFL